MDWELERSITEHAAKSKIMLRNPLYHLLNIMRPQMTHDFRLAYAFARRLDNIVDAGENPAQTQQLLEEQLRVLDAASKGKTIAKTHPLDAAPGILARSYGTHIIEPLTAIIEGFLLDNEAIAQGKPFSAEGLTKRNNAATIPPLQVYTLLAYEKTLEQARACEAYAQTWCRLDALRDLKEDLQAGLILFTEEELETHGVQLRPQQRVPNTITTLIASVRQQAKQGVTDAAQAMHKTNLGFLHATALQTYLHICALKPLRAPQTITFAENRYAA